MAILIYDDKCMLCVQLAQLVCRRSEGRVEIQPWSASSTKSDSPPQSIVLITNKQELVGAAAWEELLSIHPDLSGLTWLADRLGLKSVLVTTISGAAHLARKICRSCRLPWYMQERQ
jgi:hypothetical protein